MTTQFCHHFVNQLKLGYSVSLMDHFFLLWKVIAKARVPIVKFVERNSEIAFDIRLNFVSSLLMYFRWF
jgi:DNA polymerase sigma